MTAKKIIGKIHLWLGFATGIIVFIVSITGAVCLSGGDHRAAKSVAKVAVKAQPEVSPLKIAQQGAKHFPGSSKLFYS